MLLGCTIFSKIAFVDLNKFLVSGIKTSGVAAETACMTNRIDTELGTAVTAAVS